MVSQPEQQTQEAKEAPRQETSEPAEPRPRRRGRPGRRKVCPFCAEQIKVVDYKDVNFLRRFISDRGRIESRRKIGSCAKHQRALARAIKRARYLALLPYTPDHIRISGFFASR